VQAFYDNSLRADLDGVAKIPHPDVVNPEPASLPYGGRHKDRDEVLKPLAELYFRVDLDAVVIGDILVNSSGPRHSLRFHSNPGTRQAIRQCLRSRRLLSATG
jgi:hypothetical protein